MNARIEEIQDRAENWSWVSTIRWRVIPWCPVRWLRVGPQVKLAPCHMGNPVSHVHNRVAITQSWLTLKCRSYNCSFLCFFSLDHNMHTHIIPENHPMIHKKWTRRPLVNLLTQGRISGKIQVFIFLCGNVPTHNVPNQVKRVKKCGLDLRKTFCGCIVRTMGNRAEDWSPH